MQPLLLIAAWLLVAIIVMWLVSTLLRAFQTPEPWRSVLVVLVVLAMVVAFVQQFAGPLW